MSSKNKHGLERKPKADVKRVIREQSGFGCVICGLGIYEYEHVDPEYNEATIHDPNKMTLLCMQCHGKVTKGLWSKEKVKDAMQNPFCKRLGYSNEHFDFGIKLPSIRFAGTTLSNCQIPIQIYGDALFEIKPPEELGTPFRFSGTFFNSQGENSLRIVDNEWLASTDNWDFEVIGPTIIIREAKGKVHLKLTSVPPQGLIVEKLDMLYKDIKFYGNADSLNIIYADGRKRVFSGGFISGFPIALSIGEPKGFVAGMII